MGPDVIAVEKVEGRKWCLFYVHGEQRLLMHDKLPSKAAAREAAGRYAGMDSSLPPTEFTRDRRWTLIAHTIQCDHSGDPLGYLREREAALAQQVSSEQQRALSRKRVRDGLRDLAETEDFRFFFRLGALWRQDAEELRLGLRPTHEQQIRAQVEYLRAHLGAKGKEAA